MNGIFDILAKIKERPGMYIGKPSITDLFMFIVGYKTAQRELKVELTELENYFYREFQPWIQRKFNLESVNSWAKIIMLYSVDEKEGFNYFFELLDQFLQEKESKNSILSQHLASNLS